MGREDIGVKRFCCALWVGLAALLPAGAFGDHSGAAVPRPEAGLLWLRSDLPAVFPLQIKTGPGRDHVVTLIDTANGREALAAYVRGGQFFRVLVPPGRFRLRLASGEVWYGPAALFGGEGRTQHRDLPQELTFAVRGLRVKAGHLIDLTGWTEAETGEIGLRPQRICQVLRLLPEAGWQAGAPWWDESRDGLRRPLTLEERFRARPWPEEVPRYRLRQRYC